MKIGLLKTNSNKLEIEEIQGDINKDIHILQNLVGGYIEVLPLNAFDFAYPEELSNVIMLLDEEGKMKEKPVNFRLSMDYVVGDVVFIGANPPYMVGLTEEQIPLLQAIVKKYIRQNK